MQHPEYQLELAAEAEHDFEDILFYTLLTWGQRQMQDYSELLDHALATIQANPNIGRTHSHVAYQCFEAGQHLIFYRVKETTVFVVRILHSRMDLPRHLE
ncbi:toxin ParE1/3/4 [Burkholderia sp. D7]|nr:toxin ParE1/3/4 [Burkholderia sp. D7]